MKRILLPVSRKINGSKGFSEFCVKYINCIWNFVLTLTILRLWYVALTLSLFLFMTEQENREVSRPTRSKKHCSFINSNVDHNDEDFLCSDKEEDGRTHLILLIIEK